jgi:hypothetical protein
MGWEWQFMTLEVFEKGIRVSGETVTTPLLSALSQSCPKNLKLIDERGWFVLLLFIIIIVVVNIIITITCLFVCFFLI